MSVFGTIARDKESFLRDVELTMASEEDSSITEGLSAGLDASVAMMKSTGMSQGHLIKSAPYEVRLHIGLFSDNRTAALLTAHDELGVTDINTHLSQRPERSAGGSTESLPCTR